MRPLPILLGLLILLAIVFAKPTHVARYAQDFSKTHRRCPVCVDESSKTISQNFLDNYNKPMFEFEDFWPSCSSSAKEFFNDPKGCFRLTFTSIKGEGTLGVMHIPYAYFRVRTSSFTLRSQFKLEVGDVRMRGQLCDNAGDCFHEPGAYLSTTEAPITTSSTSTTTTTSIPSTTTTPSTTTSTSTTVSTTPSSTSSPITTVTSTEATVIPVIIANSNITTVAPVIQYVVRIVKATSLSPLTSTPASAISFDDTSRKDHPFYRRPEVIAIGFILLCSVAGAALYHFIEYKNGKSYRIQ